MPGHNRGGTSTGHSLVKVLLAGGFEQTGEGWLYLAMVLDAFSRRVVGWAMDARAETDLVVSGLNMAVRSRRPGGGVIHHSDHGAQYTSVTFTKRLTEAGLVGSMGTVGDALDNAPAESFYATLQTASLDRALADQEEPDDGDLQLHRGFLQPEAETLGAGVPQPRRVREENGGVTSNDRTRSGELDPQSTGAGQLHFANTPLAWQGRGLLTSRPPEPLDVLDWRGTGSSADVCGRP